MRNEMTNLERAATGTGGVFYGVYPATVVANDDDDDYKPVPASVLVTLPMFAGEPELGPVWARVAVPMAGEGRGTYFMPEVDDEVLVAFEAGDVDRPYVVGALWNGVDVPPIDDSENNIRAIVSRSGMTLRFDDTVGSESLSIETEDGGPTIVVDKTGSKVEIVDGNGNKVLMDSDGVSIEVATKLSVTAATVEIATGILKVNAGIGKFSGVVQCDTLIAESVVSKSYTPGAGNVF